MGVSSMGWGGPALLSVWAESAWSPRGGWVNKICYWLSWPPKWLQWLPLQWLPLSLLSFLSLLSLLRVSSLQIHRLGWPMCSLLTYL